MFAETVYAMGTNGGGQPGGGAFSLLPMLLILAVVYFLMIRPQVKKQKEITQMRAALQKGDKVVTNGGILGVITGMKEKEGIVIVKVDNNVKLEIQRSAISSVVNKTDEK